MSAADDLQLYFDTFYGDHAGYVTGALTRNPRVVDGKYKTDWAYTDRRTNIRAYKWPDRRENAVAQILEHDCDVHLAPYLMTGRGRHQDTSVPETRTHVHADNDDARPDWLERIRAIPGGVAIGSGTPGNGHGYVLLTRSVSLHHHEQLCRALGEHLGTKDNTKFYDNDCLRPAGTFQLQADRDERRRTPTSAGDVADQTERRTHRPGQARRAPRHRADRADGGASRGAGPQEDERPPTRCARILRRRAVRAGRPDRLAHG